MRDFVCFLPFRVHKIAEICKFEGLGKFGLFGHGSALPFIAKGGLLPSPLRETSERPVQMSDNVQQIQTETAISSGRRLVYNRRQRFEKAIACVFCMNRPQRIGL